jgi:hypothetical protein
MPVVIDTETLYVSDLPGIWSPVQWELTDSERTQEIEAQATASLLWSLSIPETILRLLLDEMAIERIYAPPGGYDPELQGEWDDSLVTFSFKRSIKLENVVREPDFLSMELKVADLGYWAIEIEPEKVTIERI